MGPYDSRGLILDPGLTTLALRGLHERDGHYPFDRFRPRRRSGLQSSSRPAVHPLSRWRQVLQWCGLSRRSVAPT